MGMQKKTERVHMAASGRTSRPSSSWIPGTWPTNQEVGEKDAPREGFQVEFFWRWPYKALGSSVCWWSCPTQSTFFTSKYMWPTVSNDVIALKHWILVQKPYRDQWLLGLITGFSGVPLSVNDELICHFKKGLALSPGRDPACCSTSVWSSLTQQRENKSRHCNGIWQTAVIRLLSSCFSWILLDLRRRKFPALSHGGCLADEMQLSSPCLCAWPQERQCGLSFGSGPSQSLLQYQLIYTLFSLFLSYVAGKGFNVFLKSRNQTGHFLEPMGSLQYAKHFGCQ